MKSRTSFINKGILRNDIKSMGWIGAVYLLGLLACVPLQIFMIHSREVETVVYNATKWMNNPYWRIFEFNNSPLQLLLLLVMPVLTGMLLFRYLHFSQPVDLMHTLPVKRTTLYNTHLTAGIIFLFVPILITALISALTLNGLGIEAVPTQVFFNWLLVTLITNLIFFIMTAAVAMLSGMSSVQGALSYILLLLPAAFLTLLYQNMHTHIYGFAYDYYSNNLSNLSPLLRVADFPHRMFSGSDMAVYLICVIILYLLGRFLYQRRQLEMAGNALAFTFLFPVFKYGVAFCGMLTLGSYFNSVQNNNIYWTYFGYLLGSLLGYWLSEILIYKSLHVFNRIAARGYLIFGLVMIVLIGGVNYDFTGYEKKLPELAQVESVYYNDSFYQLTRTNTPSTIMPVYEEQLDDSYRREASMIYTEPATVKDIYELHKAIITNGKVDNKKVNSRIDAYQNFCFAYKLKNGDTLYRQYNIPVNRYAAQLKPIYESQERKMKVNDILNISPQEADVITMNANGINRSVKITDPEQIKQAITALQKDVKNQTYEEITSPTPPWAQISILLNDEKRLTLGWRKSYPEFGKWLQNNGQNCRVVPDDIKYVLIEKIPEKSNPDVDKYRTKDPDEYLAGIETRGNYLKVIDPQQIEICLQNYIYMDSQIYNVVFVLNDGNSFSGGFDEKSKPDFVK